jgi:hypothetical protein
LEKAKCEELNTKLFQEIEFLRTVNEVLQEEKQKSEAETKKVIIEKEKLG